MLTNSNNYKMTLKKYQKIKLLIVFILSIVFSQTIIYQNYFLSIGVLLMASLVIYSMRKAVKEVIFDERDLEAGGKAALQAIQVYSWIGVIVMFGLKSQAADNQVYDVVATTIAFSVCFLMLLYGFIYRLKNKNTFLDNGIIFSLIVLIVFVVLAVLGILKF